MEVSFLCESLIHMKMLLTMSMLVNDFFYPQMLKNVRSRLLSQPFTAHPRGRTYQKTQYGSKSRHVHREERQRPGLVVRDFPHAVDRRPTPVKHRTSFSHLATLKPEKAPMSKGVRRKCVVCFRQYHGCESRCRRCYHSSEEGGRCFFAHVLLGDWICKRCNIYNFRHCSMCVHCAHWENNHN